VCGAVDKLNLIDLVGNDICGDLYPFIVNACAVLVPLL
jgi:hypothetical protein